MGQKMGFDSGKRDFTTAIEQATFYTKMMTEVRREEREKCKAERKREESKGKACQKRTKG